MDIEQAQVGRRERWRLWRAMSIEQQTAEYTRLTKLYGEPFPKKDGARHFESTRRASKSDDEDGEDEASTGNVISEPWERV